MNITAGEKLFQFSSEQDWVNQAQRIWRLHEVSSSRTICVDQLGRICNCGADFMAATKDNAYPIEVFMRRPD